MHVKHTFSWGCTVPDERQERSFFQASLFQIEKARTGVSESRAHIFAPLSPRHPCYLITWNRLQKRCKYFLVLKQIHPQGTRDSSEGISTNHRWARV